MTNSKHTTNFSIMAPAHKTVAGGHLQSEEAEKMKCNLPRCLNVTGNHELTAKRPCDQKSIISFQPQGLAGRRMVQG